MMLINFALDMVGTRITSDKVSTDGYESSNLISGNWHQRRKGFLAEHFIKPPVNITLEFPCGVCIHHISLTPSVGQQHSSHLELYSAAKPQRKSVPKAQVQIKNTTESPPIFYPVSKLPVSNNSRICFYNPKFGQLNGCDETHFETCDQQMATMHHFRKEIISACTHLTLRITRTLSGSTAAISNFDVWGVPALSVLPVIKNDIVTKYVNFISPPKSKKVKETSQFERPDVESPSSSHKNDIQMPPELEIPEEFIDPLTCEVMAVPMLLPCGKNVDQSSLDHFFNAEASYGRQPRDPFTGVEFSQASRPIPNGALKTRIDQFLIKHGNEKAISTIARTVGTAKEVSCLGKRKLSGSTSSEGLSTLVFQKPPYKSWQASELIQGNQSTSTNSSRNTCHETLLKTKSLKWQPCKAQPTSSHSHSPECHKMPKLSHKSNDTLKSKQDGETTNSSTESLHNGAGHSHESQLKSSLNDALSSILGSLPQYSSNSSDVETVSNLNICSQCKGNLDSNKASYVIPCHHFVCRNCLTATNPASGSSVLCGTCGKQFKKSDVIRRHQTLT